METSYNSFFHKAQIKYKFIFFEYGNTHSDESYT